MDNGFATVGRPLFGLGQLTMTTGARDTLAALWVEPLVLILRHARGDWLEMAEDDRLANLAAVNDGSRIFSRYTLAGGTRVWIITEAIAEGVRPYTTILLPEEY